MKVCGRCAIPKPPPDFYPRGKGLSSWCRACTRTYTLDWRKRFPGRRLAHKRVDSALKDGRLIRQKTCTRCGKDTYTVAHHEDYRKPLKVVWLCDQCHTIRHIELGRKVPFHRANGRKGGRPPKPK